MPTIFPHKWKHRNVARIDVHEHILSEFQSLTIQVDGRFAHVEVEPANIDPTLDAQGPYPAELRIELIISTRSGQSDKPTLIGKIWIIVVEIRKRYSHITIHLNESGHPVVDALGDALVASIDAKEEWQPRQLSPIQVRESKPDSPQPPDDVPSTLSSEAAGDAVLTDRVDPSQPQPPVEDYLRLETTVEAKETADPADPTRTEREYPIIRPTSETFTESEVEAGSQATAPRAPHYSTENMRRTTIAQYWIDDFKADPKTASDWAGLSVETYERYKKAGKFWTREQFKIAEGKNIEEAALAQKDDPQETKPGKKHK